MIFFFNQGMVECINCDSNIYFSSWSFSVESLFVANSLQLQDYMNYRKYRYLRLDGSSTIMDRRDMVRDFQHR